MQFAKLTRVVPTTFLVTLAVALAACTDGGSSSNPTSDVDVNVADTTPDFAEDQLIDLVQPESAVGRACAASSECDGGICSTLLPLGYCTLPCDAAACPTGSVCSVINDFPFCFQACTTSEQCRQADGYSCINGICNAACRSLFDCKSGEQCIKGECTLPPPDRIVGAPCVTSAECLSGYCLGESDGGVCGEPCNTTSCSLTGWTCRPLVPLGGNTALNLCGLGGVFTSDVITLTGGDPRSFNVSSDVVSFFIIAEGSVPSGMLGIENLRRPDGTLAAGPISSSGVTEPFRMFVNQGHASVMFPNNDDPTLQVQPGTWTFDIYEWGNTVDKVTVYLKRSLAGGEATQITFDMNIYLAQGAIPGVTAANAGANSHLQGALSRLQQRYWNPKGMNLGEVRYFDIDSSYLYVNDDVALHNMFADLTPEGGAGALNIFFVRDLFNGQAAGVSGGVPGPVGAQGIGGAGVAIAVQDYAIITGDNVSHEVGHYLGWFHVTEVDGTMHDVIADTPQCTQPPGQMWNYDPCMDNIMFPILVNDMVDQSLSNTQGHIARLNPRGR